MKGLFVSVKDMFVHQTIRSLAAHLTHQLKSTVQIFHSTNEGKIGLTPIQLQYSDTYPFIYFIFQLFFTFIILTVKIYTLSTNHYNQAVLLRPNNRVLFKDLQICAQEIVNHHSALRLKINNSKDISFYSPNKSPFLSKNISISTNAEITYICNQVQKEINVTGGPMIGFVLMDSKTEQRIFIVAHHLVIDAVSWQILISDLELAFKVC